MRRIWRSGVFSGLIGSVYSVAYSALYPDLIPDGFMQKGYSVSSMIYPIVTVIVSPATAALYGSYGIHVLFFLEVRAAVPPPTQAWLPRALSQALQA